MESVIVNEFGSILNTATTTGLIIGTSEKVGGNILEKIYNSANQMIDDTKNAIDNAILKTLLQIKGFENEVMRHCTP
jgi:Na+-translocating ferredoxin:NAD+ oxidoreductase RnfG subunit